MAGVAIDRIQRIKGKPAAFLELGSHHFSYCVLKVTDGDAHRIHVEIDSARDRHGRMHPVIVHDPFPWVIKISISIEIQENHAAIIAFGSESVSTQAVL